MNNKILNFLATSYLVASVGSSAYGKALPKAEDENALKKPQTKVETPVKAHTQKILDENIPSYPDPSKIPLSPGVAGTRLEDKVNTPSVDIRLPGVPPRGSEKASEGKKASIAEKYSGEAFSIGVGHESGKADKGYPMLNLAFGIGKAWYLNAGTGARGSSSEKPPITKIGTRFDAYGTESSRENESISFIGLDKRFGASYGKDGVYASLGADLYFDNTVVNKSIDEMIKDKAGNIIARSTNYPRYENNKCNVKGKFGIGVNIKNVGIEGYAKGREGEVIIGANIRYCIRSNTKQ